MASTSIRYFAINVEKNTFRRERITSQCRRFGIPLEIFKAITPATISEVDSDYSEARTRRHWGRPLMPTERACGLSHLSLWRRLLADDACDAYVIFEDDVEIQADLPEIISEILAPNVDFVKFSGQHARPKKLVKNLKEGRALFKLAYGPLDASAYLLTKRGAKDLLAYCVTLHGAIDVLMDRSYDHGVPVFAVQPYPVQSLECSDPASPLFTDIGVRTAKYAADNSWTDRWHVRINRFVSSTKKRLAELAL
ncbi:glycosyltransferase family 25 protein [Pleomorphomonas sp. JP5]|uniref:glycosyltransferase family 25 protein n=1 Tax=Pleomorphomonas sp. JP5 TaxID=2942998 RepID=UPI0020443AAB|nr:glycosyltransferase family 25 protein [Pleomorphomonas sp. JP5]MCM5557651.1 glycosyltransferase family 25 protein [Pleomorphomonas sp. JP5]